MGVTYEDAMAQITKIGNSLFALVPAHAARQLSLSHGTQIKILVDEDCIRISPAVAPGSNRPPGTNTPAAKAVVADEPW